MSSDRYPFREIEAKWQRTWEERKQFRAIEHGVHPAIWTYENIDNMRAQLKKMGISYDWERELATCDPSYYRWEQLVFIKMLERGLAYRRRSTVNWCPSCQTVLANEQVENGRC